MEQKQNYSSPKILTSYDKKELEAAIQPHGDYGMPGYDGPGDIVNGQ